MFKSRKPLSVKILLLCSLIALPIYMYAKTGKHCISELKCNYKKMYNTLYISNIHGIIYILQPTTCRAQKLGSKRIYVKGEVHTKNDAKQ